MTDGLEGFLDAQAFLLPNLNDTFGLACADTEQLSVGEGEIMAIWWGRHGWHGLVALAAVQRGRHPLPRHADDARYRDALADLQGDERIGCRDDPETTGRWLWWFGLDHLDWASMRS